MVMCQGNKPTEKQTNVLVTKKKENTFISRNCFQVLLPQENNNLEDLTILDNNNNTANKNKLISADCHGRDLHLNNLLNSFKTKNVNIYFQSVGFINHGGCRKQILNGKIYRKND